eukprot:COSAG06_NODE_9920_length_1789_cov_3.786391_1_plen_37_part_10
MWQGGIWNMKNPGGAVNELIGHESSVRALCPLEGGLL